VIDLDATFGNRWARTATTTNPWSPVANSNAEPAKKKPPEAEPELDADGNPIAKDDDDDEDDQANMSLAAMEAALKPRVLETLDRIAEDYISCPRCRTSRISATLNEDGSFSKKDEEAPTRSCAPRSWSW
jgi:RNA polymerase primary sigma factor